MNSPNSPRVPKFPYLAHQSQKKSVQELEYFCRDLIFLFRSFSVLQIVFCRTTALASLVQPVQGLVLWDTGHACAIIEITVPRKHVPNADEKIQKVVGQSVLDRGGAGALIPSPNCRTRSKRPQLRTTAQHRTSRRKSLRRNQIQRSARKR